MKRRNLSRVYILEQLDGRDVPTCFEDCRESTQDKWLESLGREALVNLARQLGKTLREVGDHFDIVLTYDG